jgi:hypothetical protein
MGTPRKVIGRLVIEVEAEFVLDRNGDVEEVGEIRDMREVCEVGTIISVLSEQ